MKRIREKVKSKKGLYDRELNEEIGIKDEQDLFIPHPSSLIPQIWSR
jgi:hypothetical protein